MTADLATFAATALLAALGDTKDQVAATLKAAGITGRRGECGACPIAVYLLRSDFGCYAVDVDGDYVALWFTADYNIQHVETVDLPAPVSAFVTSFDLGRYNDLLAGGAR